MKVEQSVSMHSHALEQPCKRQIVTDAKSRNASQLTKTSFLKSVFKCTECSNLVAKSCFVYFQAFHWQNSSSEHGLNLLAMPFDKLKNEVLEKVSYDLLTIILSYAIRAYSSSLLRAIIACNYLPIFEIFLNFVCFCPNCQIFCPFSTFLCPFLKKSHPCPYFLEQALAIVLFFLLYLFNSLVLVRLALLVISYAHGPRLTFCKNNAKFLHEFHV